MAVVPCPEDIRKPRKHKAKQLTNVNGNSTARTGEREEVCNISGIKCKKNIICKLRKYETNL